MQSIYRNVAICAMSRWATYLLENLERAKGEKETVMMAIGMLKFPKK